MKLGDPKKSRNLKNKFDILIILLIHIFVYVGNERDEDSARDNGDRTRSSHSAKSKGQICAPRFGILLASVFPSPVENCKLKGSMLSLA